MSSKITITCFDINHGLKDIKDNDNLLIENPITILDEFKQIHLFLEFEEKQKTSSEIKYTFSINIMKNIQIIYEIIILRDISFIHNISFSTDANIIFINLEKENTKQQLEKIINYINDSCSFEIKTYIIGIYKDKIIPLLNKECIESLFDEQKFFCEIYQIKYDQNDGINHLCMYKESSSKNNKSDKKKNSNKNQNDNLIDILEKILIELYESKMSLIYEPNQKKFKKKKLRLDDSKCNSDGNCKIY